MKRGSLGPCLCATKQLLDKFSRFCKAYKLDQQKEKHTDHATLMHAQEWPHPALVAVLAMRAKI